MYPAIFYVKRGKGKKPIERLPSHILSYFISANKIILGNELQVNFPMCSRHLFENKK